METTAAGMPLRQQRVGCCGGVARVFGEADHAHAHGQFAHGGNILIDMQADDGGAVFDGLHAVYRADDDRLGVKSQHECAGQQHGGNHAVHLRNLMRQKHKARQNIDQIAGLHGVHERLRGVHGQRLTRGLSASGVENAAHAVATGIEVHQGIQVFADISFFQFIAVHRTASSFAICKDGFIIHARNGKIKRIKTIF